MIGWRYIERAQAMRTKYIVGEIQSGSLPVLVAVVFPECVEHERAAQLCAEGPTGILGAGFFRVVDGQVEPYGESIGLKVAARIEDAILIAKAIGLHSCNR